MPASIREKWLHRLLTAIEDDGISYLESLADFWGELCGSAETASAWANRLISSLPASSREDLAAGTYSLRAAALSALFHAGRYEEILQMLEGEQFWPRLRLAVKALIALGKKGEALRLGPQAARGRIAMKAAFRVRSSFQVAMRTSDVERAKIATEAAARAEKMDLGHEDYAVFDVESYGFKVVVQCATREIHIMTQEEATQAGLR